MRKHGFIFHDTRGSRWPRFKLLATVGIILTITGLSLFIFSLFVAPFIDQPDSFKGIKSKIRSHDQSLKLPREPQVDRVLQRMLDKNQAAPVLKPSHGAPEIRSAFFYGWDDAAFRSSRSTKSCSHIFARNTCHSRIQQRESKRMLTPIWIGFRKWRR